MVENNDLTRREFVGTTAAAGTVLVAGSKAIPEPALSDAVQPDEMVYYVGYGSNLNVSYTIRDLLPNGRFLRESIVARE